MQKIKKTYQLFFILFLLCTDNKRRNGWKEFESKEREAQPTNNTNNNQPSREHEKKKKKKQKNNV